MSAKLDFLNPSAGLQSIDVGYIIDDAADHDNARAQMMAEAAPFLGSFVPVDFHVEPLDDSDTLWRGTVTYGPRTNNSPNGQNDPTYSFDLGVESKKITTSLATESFGARPPSFGQLINVQQDGTVEGVDINFPVFTWTETHYLPYSFVNRAYFVTLFNLTAKMNIAPFRDFQRGEVLFIGVSGSKRFSSPDWELQFKFIASPNVTNLQVGSVTVTQKLGHDYLWATYEQSLQTVSGKSVMARIPKDVYVERVYHFEDMTKLRLVNPLAI